MPTKMTVPERKQSRGYIISLHTLKNLYNPYNAWWGTHPNCAAQGESFRPLIRTSSAETIQWKYQRFIPMCPLWTVHSVPHVENTWARTQKTGTIKKPLKKGWEHSANAEMKFFQRETCGDHSDLSGNWPNCFFSSINLGKNKVARLRSQHRLHFTR